MISLGAVFHSVRMVLVARLALVDSVFANGLWRPYHPHLNAHTRLECHAMADKFDAEIFAGFPTIQGLELRLAQVHAYMWKLCWLPLLVHIATQLPILL